jgi:NADPH:quinone reductase-like Zn-dependent oxidoreductase
LPFSSPAGLAQVITTASARHREFLTQLGATEVIDYKTECFDELLRDLDLIFDGVGGATLQRSWSVLEPGGRLVTVAASGEATTADERTKAAFSSSNLISSSSPGSRRCWTGEHCKRSSMRRCLWSKPTWLISGRRGAETELAK